MKKTIEPLPVPTPAGSWLEVLLTIVHDQSAEWLRNGVDHNFEVVVPNFTGKHFDRNSWLFESVDAGMHRKYSVDHVVKESLWELHHILTLLRPLFEDDRMAHVLYVACRTFSQHNKGLYLTGEIETLVHDLFLITMQYRVKQSQAREHKVS